MNDQLRPNLFHYATSELSQDAFICWLAAWADPGYGETDSALHETARKFIASMIQKVKPEYDVSTLKAVNVRRQVGKLDILIETNKLTPDTPGELAILVEDKTHTDHHSGQLGRYYDNATKDYALEKIIPIYFKTGYQSKFDGLGDFKAYLRKDFLDVLTKGKQAGVDDAIFNDFLEHLKNMEYVVNQFLNKKVVDWTGNDWQGLFMDLQENFKEDSKADWGYVPNASGGFFGFWWNFQESAQKDYWSYLQWESGKLCFKIGFSVSFSSSPNWKNHAEAIKSAWSDRLREEDPALSSKNTKVGKTMTVVKTDKAFCMKEDGTLDLEQTITEMVKAQDTLRRVRQQMA